MTESITIGKVVKDVAALTGEPWTKVALAMLEMNKVDEEHYMELFIDLIDEMREHEPNN